MTGPLGMSGGKIWDLGAPTLDSNATNKKYVDDADSTLRGSLSSKFDKTGGALSGELNMGNYKITNLGSPTNNSDASTKEYVDTQVSDKISEIDVIDENYSVVNAEQTTYANLNTTRSEIKKLESSHISNIVEKHFHLSYSGQAKGFGFTSGRCLIAWGGFQSVSGRVSFAMIKLRGMGWRKITKIQLLGSVDTTERLQGANTALTDKLTGSFGNGTFTINERHHHFTNLTYLCVYFEGSTALVNIYFDLYVNLALE